MTYTKPDALISWVQNTHQQNTWLENEADVMFTVHEAEKLLRALQASSDRHGELLCELTINEQAFEAIRRQPETPEGSAILPSTINLFGDDDTSLACGIDEKGFAARAYRHWINHIREKGFDAELALRCGLTPQQLQMLCHVLIQASYKTDLQTYLARMIDDLNGNPTARAYCTKMVLNEFITWLGYDRVAPEMRPNSHIHRDSVLFSPLSPLLREAPLAELDNQVHSNIVWLGDWLIALYSRTLEHHEE
ncbi:putative virulence factor [Yersinia massiliensis]|uniref:virulence factor SrfC family protein n=1 Tax=Yersinia massiliensis TaxID=419257 RepID=UPI0005DBC4E3|nr:virulence factor SrfC family protein [Yersinia massiliensis]CNI14875.1 putative virulence factor [Yersinia massiliensis]